MARWAIGQLHSLPVQIHHQPWPLVVLCQPAHFQHLGSHAALPQHAAWVVLSASQSQQGTSGSRRPVPDAQLPSPGQMDGVFSEVPAAGTASAVSSTYRRSPAVLPIGVFTATSRPLRTDFCPRLLSHLQCTPGAHPGNKRALLGPNSTWPLQREFRR